MLVQPCISPLFVPLIHANRLHPGKCVMMRRQKPFGAFGIRDICWMHEHAQQEPIRINPKLPFAPIDLFPPSSPRSPPASVVLTDWESRTLMDGSGLRFSACRASFRSVSLMLIKVPSRFHGSNEERTERIGGTSVGSRRHWQPVRCLESSALTIARRSMSIGRPPLGDGVMTSGAMAAHCASVRSVA